MANNKTTWATAAIVALAIGSGSPLAAFAAPSPADCVEEGNVWVHVEYDETVTGACATEFETVLEATSSTGLADGAEEFVTTIDGRTASEADKEFWSLWTQESDGSWTFAQVGPAELKPEAGTVVSWALQPDWDVNPAPAPKADPMKTEVESKDEASESMMPWIWIVTSAGVLIAVIVGMYAMNAKKRKQQ